MRERILEGVRDDFVGEQTDQDDDRGRQFDPLGLHAHHNRPHVAQQLTEIMAQIAEVVVGPYHGDWIPPLETIVRLGDDLNPTDRTPEGSLHGWVGMAVRLQPEHGGNHLQIVLGSVLKLLQQQCVLLLRAGGAIQDAPEGLRHLRNADTSRQEQSQWDNVIVPDYQAVVRLCEKPDRQQSTEEYGSVRSTTAKEKS